MHITKQIFSDIRFWIILFFIVRLYHITYPPLEVAHNWRQTTVTMPARHFVEEGPDLFFPKVDFAGEKTGITGMEFPVLNYLIYLVSLVFGYAHWYGRLINLFISCVGLLYFHKLIQKYFHDKVAFNATFILLFSIWFMYSRKIMPDTFSVSLVIASLYYGSNYLDRKAGAVNLLLYVALALCGIMAKLPAGYLLVTTLVFLYDRNIPLQRKLVFCAASLFILIPVSAWYFYWAPTLNRVFGFSHFFMGTDVANGAREILSHYNQALEKFYAQALGYSGFLVFIAGLVIILRKKDKALIAVFTLCLGSFLLIVFKGGFAFYHHAYYIVPFAPVMALVSGFAVSAIHNKKLAAVVLAVIGIEGILVSNSDFYIKENNWAILDLEKELDHVSKRTDLIIINSDNVPTPMYFAHRNGWIENNEKIKSPEFITSLQAKGLKYIVILKRAFGNEVALSYPKIYETENVCVYRP